VFLCTRTSAHCGYDGDVEMHKILISTVFQEIRYRATWFPRDCLPIINPAHGSLKPIKLWLLFKKADELWRWPDHSRREGDIHNLNFDIVGVYSSKI
jgi:hypothetical protein